MKLNSLKRIVSFFLLAALLVASGCSSEGKNNEDEQKAKYSDTSVLSIAGHEISIAEFAYVYIIKYNEFLETAKSYINAGRSYPLNPSVMPSEQGCGKYDDNGNEILWSDYLIDCTADYLNELYILYDLALKEGLKSDTLEEEMDEYMASYKSAAVENKISLDNYLERIYFPGMSEEVIKHQLEVGYYAQLYSDNLIEKYAKQCTDSEIESIYLKGKDAYDCVDLRACKFASSTVKKSEGDTDESYTAKVKKANADAYEEALKMLSFVTDESSFISYASSLDTYKSSDADTATKIPASTKPQMDSYQLFDVKKKELTKVSGGTWCFDSSRKAGDVAIIGQSASDGTATYYVIMVTKPQYSPDVITVRQILFNTTDSSGKALSADEIKAVKEKAQKIYDEWNSTDKTESSFVALVKKYSEDSESVSSGGLYEGINTGSTATEFDKWCFDKSRKSGDSAVKESNYGVHLIYFCSSKPKYVNDISETISGDKYSEFLKENKESEKYEMFVNSAKQEQAKNQALQYIKANLTQ